MFCSKFWSRSQFIRGERVWEKICLISDLKMVSFGAFWWYFMWFTLTDAQNPLDRFPRSFPVDGEVADLLPICYRLVSNTTGKSCGNCVMDFGLAAVNKRHSVNKANERVPGLQPSATRPHFKSWLHKLTKCTIHYTTWTQYFTTFIKNLISFLGQNVKHYSYLQ